MSAPPLPLDPASLREGAVLAMLEARARGASRSRLRRLARLADDPSETLAFLEARRRDREREDDEQALLEALAREQEGEDEECLLESLLYEAGEKREVGVPFQGQSGRWFVAKDVGGGKTRVVPSKAPGGAAGKGGKAPGGPQDAASAPAAPKGGKPGRAAPKGQREAPETIAADWRDGKLGTVEDLQARLGKLTVPEVQAVRKALELDNVKGVKALLVAKVAELALEKFGAKEEAPAPPAPPEDDDSIDLGSPENVARAGAAGATAAPAATPPAAAGAAVAPPDHKAAGSASRLRGGRIEAMYGSDGNFDLQDAEAAFAELGGMSRKELDSVARSVEILHGGRLSKDKLISEIKARVLSIRGARHRKEIDRVPIETVSGTKLGGRPSATTPTAPPAHKAAILDAIRRGGSDGHATLTALRKESNLTVPEMQAAVKALQAEGVLSVGGLEGRHGISADERAHGWDIGGGTHAGHVILRDQGGKAAAPKADRKGLADLLRKSARGGDEMAPGMADSSAAQKLGPLVDDYLEGNPVPAREWLDQTHKLGRNFFPDDASHQAMNDLVAEALSKASPEELAKGDMDGHIPFLDRMHGTRDDGTFGPMPGGTYPPHIEQAMPGYAKFLREKMGARPAGSPAPAPKAPPAPAPQEKQGGGEAKGGAPPAPVKTHQDAHAAIEAITDRAGHMAGEAGYTTREQAEEAFEALGLDSLPTAELQALAKKMPQGGGGKSRKAIIDGIRRFVSDVYAMRLHGAG